MSLGEFIRRQDIIYVGGGNTANLLAVWRLHGLSYGGASDKG
ncbi:Type 1 glutamine amidotransferase-like domain-containing protein [Rothia dentocariosa]